MCADGGDGFLVGQSLYLCNLTAYEFLCQTKFRLISVIVKVVKFERIAKALHDVFC